MERRERKKGVDGAVEEDQQGLGTWKHSEAESGHVPGERHTSTRYSLYTV